MAFKIQEQNEPYSWLFYCPFYSGYYCFRFFGVAQLAVFACVHLVVNGKDVTETSFAERFSDRFNNSLNYGSILIEKAIKLEKGDKVSLIMGNGKMHLDLSSCFEGYFL